MLEAQQILPKQEGRESITRPLFDLNSAILINAYKRPDTLSDLLQSIDLALSGQDATFVIVQQQGNDVVSALIQDFICRRKNSF